VTASTLDHRRVRPLPTRNGTSDRPTMPSEQQSSMTMEL
jgi:hypothetical protein